MVVSQRKATCLTTKKTDNFTINTKNLKSNMEHKKKKRKNTLKLLEVTDNLNKQMPKTINGNAQEVAQVVCNNNRLLESTLNMLKEDFGDLNLNNDNDDDDDDDVKISENKLEDFDEEFWACKANENDNKTRTSKENNSFVGLSKTSENKNVMTNGSDEPKTCCEFCTKDNNDNLSITLQIYCKIHSDVTEIEEALYNKNKNNEEILEKNNKTNDNLTITTVVNGVQHKEKEQNKESKKEKLTEIGNSVDLGSEYVKNLKENEENKIDNLRTNDNDNPLCKRVMTEKAECSSNNCLCFCNETGAHSVLSLMENGFVLNNDNKYIDESDNECTNSILEDEIDENDLPNYSSSCVYEERIIDFENFRIIEQVIDNNCEGKHTATNNIKCRDKYRKDFQNVEVRCNGKLEENDSRREDIDFQEEENPTSFKAQETTPLYINPAINFSCSELVAFIGESYQVIDNAQTVYNKEKRDKSFNKPVQYKAKECVSVGNSPFKRSKRTVYATGSTSSPRSVDDNNNTRRYTGLTAAERLMQSLNCDVARELSTTKRDKREVKVKTKSTAASHKTATPTKTLLKALKSNLTPLAPPFEPAAIKNKAAQNVENKASSGTVVNYEHTTVYYQQQQPPLFTSNNMLQAFTLATTNQQQQPQGQTMQLQQVTSSQQQQHQQHQLYINQIHHQQLPHQHHQQHCAQNILAMAASFTGQALPSIHLPTTAVANATNTAATNNATHLSDPSTAVTAATLINMTATSNPTPPQRRLHAHQHLLPVHLISSLAGASVGALTTAWPLLEATPATASNATVAATTTQSPPIYMDINGELRTICPAHGPPPTAVTITAPMAPITNQTVASLTNPALVQQASGVCFNPSQYPLAITAQYQAQQQQPQQQHQQNTTQIQPQQFHHHNQQHQPSLAQNSPLRLKSSLALTTANNSSSSIAATSSSSTSASASSLQSSSTVAAAATAQPRVVLQLDAGVSLPLQIAGKRKTFRGKHF